MDGEGLWVWEVFEGDEAVEGVRVGGGVWWVRWGGGELIDG